MHHTISLFAILVVTACSGKIGGGGSSDCPPDVAYFESRVWRPVLSTMCVGCHSETGVAKATDFVLQPAGTDGYLEHNLEVTRAIALEQQNGESVLLLRPTGQFEGGHAGGTVFDEGSTSYAALRGFVDRVTGAPGACDVGECTASTPGPRMLRRLTPHEYDNTIRDLFGFESVWGETLAADVVVHGFDNNAYALTVTPLLADQLRGAAEEIAAQVILDAPARLPCDLAGGDRECARQLATGLGSEIFRRPLAPAEVDGLLEVYDVGAGDGGFAGGAELMLAAMLQSPAFLYRSEIGTDNGDGTFALTPWEIASELSYLIWASIPDAELRAAAASGELADPEEIERQARRMLADPRAAGALGRFFAQWLEVDTIETVPKDTMLYPELDDGARRAMAEETRRFLTGAVLDDGATLADLLLADHVVVNAQLAALYGLPAPAEPDADGWGRVPAAERGGLLALGAVLTTHARANSSSPVHRGKMVRERLLCQTLPPPPPGVSAEPPEVDPSLTTRERFAQHASDPACRGCHELMDPIGFAFEKFDGIGRWRDDESGLAIDDSGEIIRSEETDGAFQGVRGLADALAASPEVHRCFAVQMVRFGYGVAEDDLQTRSMSCLIDDVAADFAGGDGDVVELIVALTQTPHFRLRTAASGGGGDESDGDGDGEGDGEGDGDGDGDGDSGAETSPGLEVTATTTNDWGTGYCVDVDVANPTAAAIDWTVVLDVDGTIDNHWDSELAQSGSQAVFTGVAWNEVAEAGAAVGFGFCATR